MAKKITKEEYEKKLKEKNIETKFFNSILMRNLSLAFNGVLIVALIVIIVLALDNNNKLENKIETKKEDYRLCREDFNSLTDSYQKVSQKANFLDNNVVFIIKGYGNYYYTYNCMMKKVGSKRYYFRALTDVEAKGYGYKKGKC